MFARDDFVNAAKLLITMTFAAGTFARRNAFLPLDNPIPGLLDLLALLIGRAGNFVNERKLLMSMTFARKNAREGDGSEQELGEVAEGGGLLARDAPLGEQAKDLAEGAVHAGGGGEVTAGGI